MIDIKTYVISVPSLYHRLDQSFWPSIKKVKSIKPELYEGVEGKNYDMPEWWTSKPRGGCIYEETFEPAVWGLIQTYVDLFEKLINEKVDEPILILEDDSVLIDPESFDRDLELFIKYLPNDWVVGYISGYHGKNKREVINEYVTKVSSVMQTNAVLYNGYRACEILREYILTMKEREPIDVALLGAYNTLKLPLYRSNKKLMFQESYQCSTVLREYRPGRKLDWEI